MFSILSWVGDAPRSPPDSAAQSPWPAREVKKEKVTNRWVRAYWVENAFLDISWILIGTMLCEIYRPSQMTESQDQFAWPNKVVPVENRSDTIGAVFNVPADCIVHLISSNSDDLVKLRCLKV